MITFDGGGGGGSGGDGGGGDDGTVPRSALIREREKRQEAEQKAAEVEARLAKLEEGGKSEVAQAIGRAERAEAKISELTAQQAETDRKLKTNERGTLLRDALLALDGDKKVRTDAVSAAVRLANLDDIEDASAAKKAATKLLDEHPFLVASGNPPPPRQGTAGSGRQGTSTGENGGRSGQPMLDEKGKTTDEFKRGFGNFLLEVAGRGRDGEGQPTT